jgi:glutamate dehydrogenase/leucine dehydrogenase
LRGQKSSGGIRISDTIDEDEIRAMARSMTLKYLILHRQMGGAKCGIRIPQNCDAKHKRIILTSFGKKAAGILQKRQYIPYMDMNCTKEDIKTILTAAHTPFYKISDSSYFTALSVISSIKAASMFQQRTLQNRSVIIEGFGNVGSHIASELEQYGIRLVGISTKKGAIYRHEGFSIPDILKQRKALGDDVISKYPEFHREPKEMLLKQPCDILVPCARYHSINQKNMEAINTAIIAPGANNPYDEGVEPYLFDQGVICLPDFVTNIGGILGTSLYDNGISMNLVHRFFDDEFSGFIHHLCQKSMQVKKPPGSLAVSIAKTLHHDTKKKEIDTSKRTISPDSLFPIILSYLPAHMSKQYHLFMETRRLQKNIQILKKLR